MTKSNVRSGARRGNRRGGSKSVVSKFSWQQRQNDAILFRGSVEPFTVNSAASGTQTYSFPLDIEGLGTRASSISALYLRYKLNAIKLRYISSCPTTTTGAICIGIADDADDVTAGTSVNPDQLRISNINSAFKDFNLFWTPIDKEKWYYCSTNSSGTTNDQRFNQPAALIWNLQGVPVNTTLGYIYVEYELVLKGATPSNII